VITNEQIAAMTKPAVVSSEDWNKAWQELLIKEKELMHMRDALAASRRRMPWLAVEKPYTFLSGSEKKSLLDLFEGRRQLVLYRAFFDPGVYGFPEHACVGCSLGADQISHLSHLHARDTTLVYASRGTQEQIAALKDRMDWHHIPWVTITDTFDKDFGVDEWHGHNVFFRDEHDNIFRTYYIKDRGDEAMGSVWSYLDITPLGRQEKWEDSPANYPQTDPYKWWRWHDSYGKEDKKWSNVVDAASITLNL
jgi:predicted dithiol-disulfide oxidoreductase (DUF899 family)